MWFKMIKNSKTNSIVWLLLGQRCRWGIFRSRRRRCFSFYASLFNCVCMFVRGFLQLPLARSLNIFKYSIFFYCCLHCLLLLQSIFAVDVVAFVLLCFYPIQHFLFCCCSIWIRFSWVCCSCCFNWFLFLSFNVHGWCILLLLSLVQCGVYSGDIVANYR